MPAVGCRYEPRGRELESFFHDWVDTNGAAGNARSVRRIAPRLEVQNMDFEDLDDASQKRVHDPDARDDLAVIEVFS